MTKLILGIESSCDETAAAILQKDQDQLTILANIVASSADLQAKYGGIIPEQAAREQLKSIISVINEALTVSQIKPSQLDALAITQGPGLISSLLIGVETMKVLAEIWQKPLIPVNHLIGHFYANWITTDNNQKVPTFPCVGLLVSGGHSDLVLFTGHGEFQYLGGTRDDAAGECFDKCARLLGFSYPGGPKISKIAEKGNPKEFNLPRPMIDSADLDFSFSGLKTAFANLVNKYSLSLNDQKDEQKIANLCASLQQAIIDSLTHKTIKALNQTGSKNLIVAGGVAANSQLINQLKNSIAPDIQFFSPPPYLCTDNGAMITAAAFFIDPTSNILDLQANPNLSLAY